MPAKDRGINIPLNEDMHDVLGVLTTRDRQSVPALLRPEIERYLKRRLRDPKIKAAVDAIRESRAQEAARRSEKTATITPLPTASRGQTSRVAKKAATKRH
jgi:hypothetical protein